MAAMAVLVILLIGVAIYSLSQMKPETWTSSLKEPDIQPTLRQNLPNFEYSNEGQQLKTDDFKEKWTLLSFWANWCEPCREELPLLNQLSQQWQGPEFDVVTVNIDEPRSESLEAARKFLSEGELQFRTLFDTNGVLKRAFSVTDLSQHFLISPEGKIVWQAKGAFQWTSPKAIDQLMKIMEDSADDEDEASTPAPDSNSPAKDSAK